MWKVRTELTPNNNRVTFLKFLNGRERKIGNDEGEVIEALQSDVVKKNLRIEDLLEQIDCNIQAKANLHSRIDVLEKIVRENNLWEKYCVACDNNK